MSQDSEELPPDPRVETICPKCHKPSWKPYVMKTTNFYGTEYRYLVYRHPDGRRRTPRRCTVGEEESAPQLIHQPGEQMSRSTLEEEPSPR